MDRSSATRAGCILALGLAIALVATAQEQLQKKDAKAQPKADAAAAVKSLLADELAQVERDLAGRMIRRTTANLDAEQRAYLELGIDLRVIERAIASAAAAATPLSNEQAVLWHRARQVRAAIAGFEEMLARNPPSAPTASQKESLIAIRKMSFEVAGSGLAGGGETKAEGKGSAGKGTLDTLCRNLAVAMARGVSPTPPDVKSLPVMRPTPLPREDAPSRDRPLSVSDLADQIHKSAALSIPLRQHLLALVKEAQDEKNGGGPAHQMLGHVVTLARGLQGNTGVTAEQRAAIETQVTEGLALFMDPRTRDAGMARVESLAQYRQLVGRLAKLSLSREQMEQLSPAIAWAQAAGEPGMKFMAALEKYFDVCGKWDALVKHGANAAAIPPLLRRAYDDLAAQFAKERVAVWNDAVKVGSPTAQGNGGELDGRLGELTRLHGVMDDVLAMGKSIDTLAGFKVRPVGGLEKKAQIAAIAAAGAGATSANRAEGERFLKSVRRLADLAQKLSGKPLTDLPAPVVQAWAGGKAEQFEARWKGIVLEQAQSLTGGAITVDAFRASRLEMALAMGEALRTAAELEAGLAKADALSRWVDWGVDAATLRGVIEPYRESLSAAFGGFASDLFEPVEQWNKLRGRYQPLVALVVRDAGYAEQCERMPIGFAGDVAKLATPMEGGGAFGTERFAGYAVGVWAALERSGEEAAADRVAVVLARRLARDLGMETTIEDTIGRGTRKAKSP